MKRLPKVVAAVAATFSAGMFAASGPASADIFQWQYINPGDPSQGKQPSTALCPGGAGVNAAPDAYLSYLDSTKAYLIGADLSNARLNSATLTNAGFSQAILTSANFTASEVRGADFGLTGLTTAQLYSTVSYQNHDLTGIGLSSVNLSGGNFAGQNLTNAKLFNATLTGANFTGAEVRAASLSGVDFTAG